MKSFICLIRQDRVACIYIFIRLRKHYVRALSANVIKGGNLKFQFFAWEASPKGGKWGGKEHWMYNLSKNLLSCLLWVSGDASASLGGDLLCDHMHTCLNVLRRTEQPENMEHMIRKSRKYITSDIQVHSCDESMWFKAINYSILLEFKSDERGTF